MQINDKRIMEREFGSEYANLTRLLRTGATGAQGLGRRPSYKLVPLPSSERADAMSLFSENMLREDFGGLIDILQSKWPSRKLFASSS